MQIQDFRSKRVLAVILCAFLAVSIALAGILIAQEMRLCEQQEAALQELEDNRGTYDEHTIVLYDTSKSEAESLAKKFDAKLRITSDGKFATLTLREDVSVYDVYSARANRSYLPQLSLDYYARTSAEEEGTGERLPSAPDYTVTDGYYSRQTYLNYLHIGETWLRTQGSGITVAVIDTGIDTDHPEFAGKISEYSYNATEDKIVKDYTLEDGSYDWSLIEDEQGHGTAVSGVIAASMDGAGVVGVAPEAEILVIKAECDANGSFYNTSDLVFGLYYAIEQGVDVVNMSFGSYIPENPFASATKLAVDSDIVCVAAAGNDGTTALSYPAADENVIGVGALAQDSWELAAYSNYGENTDIVAPGTVYTTLNDGGYGVMNGTSFASPATAAAIALYMQQSWYREFAEIREMLYASSYDLGSLGKDWYFGYGALDINALVCEERGTVTFNMLTDELEDIEQVFVRNHTLQNLPEPERLYAVFDGWYFDIQCTEELQWYEDVFTSDLTLYAKWVNEDDGVPYTYVTLDDGTVEIRSYTGHRRYITIPNEIEGKTVSSIGDFAFDGESNFRQINLPSGLTHIGAYAFRNCNNLVSVSVPSGVTEIGEYAFYNDVRLSSVAFAGNALTTIGEFAFAYCGGLARIELPASVTDVEGSAFYGDTALTSIGVQAGSRAFTSVGGVLYNHTASILVAYPAGLRQAYTAPSGLRSIGDYAFAYARLTEIGLGNVQRIGNNAFAYSALESLTIPDTVTVMGTSAFSMNFYLREIVLGSGLNAIPQGAFSSCFALESVHIPANITSIGGNAFASCGALASVTFAEGSLLTQIGSEAFSGTALADIGIPASVVMIGSAAFANNFALSSVTFGANSSLQVIANEAFKNSDSLAQIDLPENLMRIGDYAFRNSALKAIELPASLIQLGAGAFASCGQLTQITVAGGNEVYKDVDGVVYNIDATEIVAYPAGKPVTSYTVESTVTVIGDAAFYGAGKLTSVILPSGLETVGAYGFYGCTGIQSYILPETLTYIEDYAFSQNTSLTSLAIPDAVYQIGRYAFANDYALRSVTFTANSTLPRIGYAAFGYTGLTSFRVPASVSTIAQEAFIGCSDLTSITFAANSSLTSISAYMFKGCDNLRTITFENGSALTSIQAHGLEGMSNLTTVNFGDAKITNIDNYAFRYNEKLVNITLPSTVEYIGRYAFYGCSALTRLDLPGTIEYIGRYAFYGANNLNVYFEGDTLPLYLQENWDAGITGYYVGVQDVVTSGDWAYAVLNSGNISIIKYNGSETEIDLTTLDLDGDIVSIGGYAFYNTAVTSVVLPDTLTSIQAYAFARSQISEIVIPANVEYIAKYAFFYTPLTSVTVAPDSDLKVMEQWAFAYTRELNAITLPASLQTMGSNAFYHSGITSVNFAENSVIAEIPASAFASSALMSVVLPDSVTLIDDNAFRDCVDLQSVTFGEGENLQLMSNVFYNTGLTSLYIPANLTYIGEYAFVGLQGLEEFTVDENNPNYSAVDGVLYDKEVSKIVAVPAGKTGSLTLPETLETIGYGAFENSSLETIFFDENSNILSIGYRAFYGADALTQITIPASVVSIDYYAFAMCENLETVVFAEGSRLTGVYEGAFYGCTSLSDIVLPDSVVEISDFAFYGCISLTQIPVSEDNELLGIYSYAFAYTGITELTLPETLIDIGEYAFRGAKLTKVIIPETNREQLIIGLGAFADCNDLTEITLPFIGALFEDTEITWFGYIFGAGGYAANNTYVPESLKTVTISEGITFIGLHAFEGIDKIEKINIPYSVTMVYIYAFYNCTASYEFTNTIYLDGTSADRSYFGTGVSGSLILGEGITNINFSDSFINSSPFSNLERIDIPASVKSIGEYAFFGCSSLTSVSIPEGVTSIGSYAFWRCSSLKSIEIPSGVTSIEYGTFSGCSSLMRIEIPSGVTSIGDSAFSGCSSLTSISIPDGVTSIRANVFNDCSSLKSIEIPSGVTSIGSSAFSDCSSLTSITIPKGVTSIGYRAFYNCSSLMSIEIPSSVVSLEVGVNNVSGVFENCSNLRNVIFEDGSQIKDIGNDTFYGCSNLKSIEIPSGVTSIGFYAFFGCNSLGIVTFSENSQLTSIGDNVFSGCSNLTSIEIPSGVTSIGNYAFGDCNNLYEVINHSDLSFTLGSSDHGWVAYYAKVLIDQEGNKIYKDEGSDFTYIDTADGFRFTQENGVYTLIAYLGEEETVTLPEDINGNEYTIYQMRGVKNVIIPDTMTSIEDNAFSGCSSLMSITIPDSVTSIGEYAFSDCNSLTSIAIPDGVTSIEQYAFSGCSSLTSVNFDEDSQLTSISGYTFFECIDLKSISIPNGVTSIESDTFYGCSSLTSVSIPEGVTSIGSSAFSGCSSLMSVSIPEGVTSIGSSAFSGCSSLMSISISDSVISIGQNAFFNCSNLIELNIHADNVAFIEEKGIIYNKAKTQIVFVLDAVTEVTIPATVTNINTAFSNKVNLCTVTFEAGSQLTNIEQSAFSGCSSLTSIEIPDGVTDIGSGAFYGCSRLTNIRIPSGVTSIGSRAFYNCSSLTSIEIPDGVTGIGSGAFYGCSNLKSVTFGENSQLTSIGSEAFSGCSSLKSIEIPSGVNSFVNGANSWQGVFASCSSLENVTFKANSKLLNIGNGTFYNCSSLTSIEIPNGVTSIESDAFYGCSSLTSVKIPNGVTSIGSYAFYNCSSLTSIEIPIGVTDIGDNAFSGCSSLKSIEIPGGMTVIRTYVFSGCSSLTSITIPDGVTNIWSGAFSGCSSLNNVGFGENSQLTSIGEGAFNRCGSLMYIEIPSSVMTLEGGVNASGGVFANCGNLTKVIFEDSSQIKDIGNYTFYGCSGLTSIEIPESVTSIGDRAFYNCNNLYEVINHSDLQFTLGSTNHGWVAYYAKVLIDQEGNKIYKDEGSDFTYIDTADGFRFTQENGVYTLIAYLGEEETVTLPEDINGNEYTIYQMRGVKNVIIPDTMTSIEDNAFSGCSSLMSITIPDSVTSIGDRAFSNCSSLMSITIPSRVTSIGVSTFYNCSSLTSVTFGENSQLTSIEQEAFYGCSSLTNIYIPNGVSNIGLRAFYGCDNLIEIDLPDSVTKIWDNAFGGTAYYNNVSNWVDGCLYIGNHLIRGQEDIKYFIAKENISAIADDAFDGCYQLVLATIGGNHSNVFSSLTNLETLIITDMPTLYVYQYSIPSTLKTIVLKDGVQVKSRYLFQNITGVTIYVEANEFDVMWDEDYPNWNNGNTVYYGGEWINATFYDADGNILDSGYYLTSQVVRQPYYELASDEQFDYVMVGWDLDGDGIADSIPATSAQNLSAHAIIEQSLRNYTVTFLDADGTALYTYMLPYGSAIDVPTPVKTGYTFLGWEGYTDGMTVTGDISFIAQWQHEGEGHAYGEPEVIAPTCTEQGYTKHVCTICGEWYATDFVDAIGHQYGSELLTKEATCTEDGYIYYLCAECGEENIASTIEAHGHNYGEWVIEKEASCTEDGLRYHVCGECDERVEEIIVAIGHNYVGTVTKESSCEEYGEITYTCEHCGDTVTELLDKTEHRYVKKYVPKSWLRLLVETLLNIFFGYEGNDGYYFECADCRHIQTSAEAMMNASVQSTCEHVLGEEQLVMEASCEGQGVYGRYCSECGELVEARTVDALGHEYNTTILAPTCSEYGYTLHQCTRCDDYYITDIVDKVAHAESEWIVDVAADCTHDGSRHKECTVCEEILETEVIEATEHDYGEVQTVAATCEQAGYTYHVCSVCEYEEKLSDISALGHTESEWIVDVVADCTHDGSRHKECTVCREILETEVIEATGHSYGATQTIAATCEQAGYTYHVCETCGHEEQLSVIEANGHTEGEWIVDVAADCTHDGSRHKECTECKELLGTEVIEATEHSYGEIQTVAATCEQAGYTYHVCETCGHEERLSVIDAFGHTEGEWIVDVVADCTHDGSQHKVCTVCGKLLGTEVIEATGHSYSEEQTVEATCEQAGYTYHVCSVCEYEEKLLDIPASGHTPSEWIVDVVADCTHDGSRHKECTVCREILGTEVIEATEHSYGDIQTVAATCEQAGYTYHVCETCGHEERLSVIDAFGHAEGEWIVDVEADCTHDGSQHKECTVCGKLLGTEVIEATGHSYGEEQTVAATCEQAGYTYHVCSVCEYEEKLSDISALGHTESEWIVDVTVDCTHDGSRHKECMVCDEILETEEINATGHSYGEIQTVAATCEQAGHTYHVCETCGYAERVSVIEPKGHIESNWNVDVEADCTHAGSQHKVCTVCGKLLETEVIEETGHNYGDIQTVSATCEQAGYTYHVCETCGYEERLSVIEANGHAEGEWIVDVEADCTHAGSQHKECTVCGEILETEEIEATGHSYGEEQTVAATCEQAGYTYHVCETCGYEERLSVIEANGHAEGEWIVDVEAGCTHAGSRHKECTVCGEILETEEIEATEHDYGEVQTVAATCEQAGHTYHVCSTCGYEEKLSDIPALEHTESDWIMDVEADCTHGGSRHKECMVCGEILETEVIEAAGHSYGEVQTVEATCEQAGYTYHTCSVCGHEEILSTIEAKGHTESEWIVDVEADCTHEGSRHKECTLCDKILIIEQILPYGHGELEWIVEVEPDCTHEGFRYNICHNCGMILMTEMMPRLEHEFGAESMVEATCEEDGYHYRVCERCGYIEMLDVIESQGHQYTSAVTEPGCCTAGFTEHVCSECGAEYTDEYTAALGHTASEWITDREATETQEGERHIVCIVCGEELLREKIPVLSPTGVGTGTVAVIAVGTAAGAGGIGSLIVWIILRKRKRL